jgi:cysteine desulfurase / selenocysteine lyase
MNLAELLANEELRQHEFPVARAKVFLAHAGVCPIPRRVAEAIRGYAASSTLGDQETLVPAFRMRETRELAAGLLCAHADEIAFVGPTSLALSFVAGGLSWKKGDNIVVYFDDYPANVYPWMALAALGVQVRFLQVRQFGCIEPGDVMEQVDEQTRLVALASCHFVSGFRPDIQAIGQCLRARGVLFCVDAIQTLGAFPASVEFVDFLAADAHKWLLGPCAAGILYVRREIQVQMRPVASGWHNVQCPNFVAQEHIQWQTDARRYEAGSANLLGLAGLHAALELIAEMGVDAIAAELLRKRAWFVPAVREQGWQVLSAESRDENASGIMSLWRDGQDMAALHRRLEESQVIASLRLDRQGRQYLRLSPHFYNTDAELRRVLDLLPNT